MRAIAINGSPRKAWNTASFDAQAKKKRREEVFPQDCRRAFELGARLTATAKVEV